MTMTDDELARLISTEFGAASLTVGRDIIERRGRQRRRRARVTAVMALLAVLAGVGAYGLDRKIQADQVAAFNRGCQSGYTAEADASGRGGQLPAELDAPVIELRRGDARLRLYASDPGPLRSMTFLCVRATDGSITGRLSYGSNPAAKQETPIRATRSYLPDGTVAIVAHLRDSAAVLSVQPAHGDVQVTQVGRLAVAWGPQAALAGATLHTGENTLDLTRDSVSPTSTFDETDFEQQCRVSMNRSDHLRTARFVLTGRDRDTVLRVYRAGPGIAVCSWQNPPDVTAVDDTFTTTFSYDSPVIAVASSPDLSIGSFLSTLAWDGNLGWQAGPTPPATERVVIVAQDGTEIEAKLGDGAYLAWVPVGRPQATVITTTTTTTTYPVPGAKSPEGQ
jgi:hypothetical protein